MSYSLFYIEETGLITIIMYTWLCVFIEKINPAYYIFWKFKLL